MSASLARVVDAFAGLRVVVVGDVILDRYLDGPATRLCREAPVPVVRLRREDARAGGAANTAANLAALGARVEVVASVGADPSGEQLRRRLAAAGVGLDHLVTSPTRHTPTFTRVTASSQLLVRFDEGSDEPLEPALEAALVGELAAAVPGAVVVVSDYGYGQVTPGVIDALAGLRRAFPGVVVVDSKHPAAFRRLGPTAVKPNWEEARRLLGQGELDGVSERADGLAGHGERILELTGARLAAVTLDCEGAVLFERGRPPHRTYARRPPGGVPAVQPAGAGDTFVAALALALGAGASTVAAAELASAAAAVVVGREGTDCCSAADLRGVLSGAAKVVSDRELTGLAAHHREQGRRLVFTNGCFDILHRGHITYLNRAKTLGDVLVVAVNDDAGVGRLKGASRPVNPLDDRMAVLAALSCVDHIVPFSSDTPVELIEAVRPDVYVKGGDHRRETLPEVPVVERLGGTVRLLDFMEDRSTTGIIERIRRRQAVSSS